MALTPDEALRILTQLPDSHPTNILLYGKFNPVTEQGHGKLIELGMDLASSHPNSRLGVFYPPQSVASTKAYGKVNPGETRTIGEQVAALQRNASSLTPAESRKLEKEVLIGDDRLQALRTVVANTHQRRRAHFPTVVGPRTLDLGNLANLFDQGSEEATTFLVAGTDRAGPDGAYNSAIKDGQYLVIVDRPEGSASSSETRARIAAAKPDEDIALPPGIVTEIGLGHGLHTATPSNLVAKTVHTIWTVPDELKLGRTRRVKEQEIRRRAQKTARKDTSKSKARKNTTTKLKESRPAKSYELSRTKRSRQDKRLGGARTSQIRTLKKNGRNNKLKRSIQTRMQRKRR